jgi:methylisocitrate lyase
MVDRIKAAVAARGDPSFVIMARTDAYASEGLEGVIRRGLAYKEAGADMIFPEALQNASEFGLVAKEVGIPVLANMTEFGKTPLMKAEELGSVGVGISLYPLSAFRAMSMAAMSVYEAILRDGTQAAELENMHTRLQIYDVLNYEGFERQMDELFGKEKENKS